MRFAPWPSMRVSTSSRKRIASEMYGPLLSITHSARLAQAASVTSDRVGDPVFANDSSTCVAQMTGTCAASVNHRISSWTSASRSNPTSAARSPRAIITATGGRRSPRSNRRGSASNAASCSIFRITPTLSAPSRSSSRCAVSTSPMSLTYDSAIRSTTGAMVARVARSSASMAGSDSGVSGRLMPLPTRIFADAGCTISTSIVSRLTATTTPSTRPSSTNTRWPSSIEVNTAGTSTVTVAGVPTEPSSRRTACDPAPDPRRTRRIWPRSTRSTPEPAGTSATLPAATTAPSRRHSRRTSGVKYVVRSDVVSIACASTAATGNHRLRPRGRRG